MKKILSCQLIVKIVVIALESYCNSNSFYDQNNSKHMTFKSLLALAFIFFSVSTFSQVESKESKSIYPKETEINSLRKSQLNDEQKDKIIYSDITGDGTPDIIELWWNGKRLRWFDEGNVATYNDKWGDMRNGALQVDMDGDGFYDGPGDYSVKWADTDSDGIPDVQVFSRNPAEGHDWVFGASGSIYFVIMDPDNTGLLTDIDWNDLSVSWTRWDRGPNWRTNYYGNVTFLKEHAPIWSVENPEYTWENPFLFYDFDNDGLPEMSIRVADNRIFMKEDRNRLQFDGIVDEAWLSIDIDNDNGHGNEVDYDLTLYVGGSPGVNYQDHVHEIPELKAPEWVLPYYRHGEWRLQTKFRYIDRENAVDELFGAKWAKAYLTFDEDDDCQRWERVEIYYPGDPYLLKRQNNNAIITHPQSDALGDRSEWDMDFSGEGKLYRASWDGKIHLLGAEKGAWTVDINGAYNAAVHPNGVSSSIMPDRVEEVIQYTDSDENGFFDVVSYDYNGDGTPNRVDSLLTLGVSDEGNIMDVTLLSYEELRMENIRAVNANWQHAQRLFRTAFKFGYVNEEIISFSKATSIREKYHKAFWLKEHIVRHLLSKCPQNLHSQLLRYYYNNDIEKMDDIIQQISNS